MPLLRSLTAPLIAAVLLAGCGGENPAATGDDPVPITSLGEGSPSPTPAPTEAAPTQQAPGYPDTAQEYAQEVIAAWKAGDYGRLGDLTNALAQQQLLDETGSPPNMDWTLIGCDGTAGASYCRFYNADGHEVRLKITHQKLGGPDACTEAVYQVTPFPDDGEEYVKVLVQAWLDGNRPRMKLLARPVVLEDLTPGHAPKGSWTDSSSGGAGLQFVNVYNAAGFYLQFQVGTTLLGGPEAVRAISPPP